MRKMLSSLFVFMHILALIQLICRPSCDDMSCNISRARTTTLAQAFHIMGIRYTARVTDREIRRSSRTCQYTILIGYTSIRPHCSCQSITESLTCGHQPPPAGLAATTSLTKTNLASYDSARSSATQTTPQVGVEVGTLQDSSK